MKMPRKVGQSRTSLFKQTGTFIFGKKPNKHLSFVENLVKTCVNSILFFVIVLGLHVKGVCKQFKMLLIWQVADYIKGGWIQKLEPRTYKFPDSEKALSDAIDVAGPTLGPILISMSEFLITSLNESYQSRCVHLNFDALIHLVELFIIWLRFVSVKSCKASLSISVLMGRSFHILLLLTPNL